VHVLSHDKKKSFHIVGGEGMRLQSPAGVAVDGEGNLYISDSARGMIFVYDSAGRFIRTMGSYGDEGIFHSPAGLAIDPRAGRLYIVDPPIHTLFIFDLKGTLLTRVEPREGGFSVRKGSDLPGEFEYPYAVLIHNDELFVRDATRIHVLDLNGNVQREFPVASGSARPTAPFPGFFVDQEGRIFVADTTSMTVQEYSPDGKLLDAFGRPGLHPGEFSLLAGMWANPGGRIYIIDGNRIQLFQFEQQ
jgi:tripartite motif-containing protein 71